MRPILRLTPAPSNFSTAFPATENPLSQSGAWRTAVNFYRAPQTTPGKCFSNGATDNFDDALAQLVSPNMGNNYRIGLHVFRQGGYSPGVSHEIGLYLRLLIDNSNPSNTLVRGYECLFPYDSGSFQLVAWLGVNHSFPDNFSILSPTAQNGGLANVQNGDLLEAEIVGNDISVYQNSTLIYTLTDSTWTSGGGPGMGFYTNTGATPQNFCPTDFTVQRL
jgi:hypothetical protein